MNRPLALACALLLLSGCAAEKFHRLPIQASQAPRLFAPIAAAAEAMGYTVYTHGGQVWVVLDAGTDTNAIFKPVDADFRVYLRTDDDVVPEHLVDAQLAWAKERTDDIVNLAAPWFSPEPPIGTTMPVVDRATIPPPPFQRDLAAEARADAQEAATWREDRKGTHFGLIFGAGLSTMAGVQIEHSVGLLSVVGTPQFQAVWPNMGNRNSTLFGFDLQLRLNLSQQFSVGAGAVGGLSAGSSIGVRPVAGPSASALFKFARGGRHQLGLYVPWIHYEGFALPWAMFTYGYLF